MVVVANILVMFVVLAVHELGHLLSGIYQGFRFELFVVGPLGIKREGGKIKVYFNKNIEYYGGVAATLPREPDPSNAKKFANVLLAGPIASLLFAAILGILCYFLDSKIEQFLAIGSVASIGIFLATTIPSKSGSFFTDRKRYQRLTSDGPEREVELAVLRVTAVYSKNSCYLDADAIDIEMMIDDDNYKFLGLFTKLHQEYEKDGHFSQDTEEQYKEVSLKTSKSLVKFMDKELEKLKNGSVK